MRRFAENARILCGQAALLLGWRPAEFWAATPAELGSIIAALSPYQPVGTDSADMAKLMEQFPDG